jgi:N-acetylglutamate synthase-like GNAT family acetyltransferase
MTASVEILVRDARLTDIDRITGLMERADARRTLDQLDDSADILRQMLYLPNASVLVALDGRMVVGAAALTLRPSVAAGGMIGTVDLMAIEPDNELDGTLEALLQELLRQSRNKGCVALEGALPSDPAEAARWEQVGFAESGSLMRCPLVRVTAAAW